MGVMKRLNWTERRKRVKVGCGWKDELQRAGRREGGRWGRKGDGVRGRRTALTDLPYGDRLRPTVEVLLSSALTNAAGGDAGKANSTKPFQGLPIIHPYNPGQIHHT